MEEWNDENDRTEMGNSLAILMPKRVAEKAGLREKELWRSKYERECWLCLRICGESIV
jgi:hypothetical protein